MKKVAAFFCSAILVLGISSEANALFVISNVSMTTNSVTFTIDGDMTGYAAPATSFENMITMTYSGDIFSSPGMNNYTPNTWSSSMFDNHDVIGAGNTGTWTDGDFTWTRYDSSLSDAVAANKTVTITTGHYFNPSESGTITFNWGHPSSFPATKIGEATFPVPEPSAAMFLGIGGLSLMGMAQAKRRKNLDAA